MTDTRGLPEVEGETYIVTYKTEGVVDFRMSFGTLKPRYHVDTSGDPDAQRVGKIRE